ncbi:MAG: 4'-phosphopantetheinyl transferase superfamily protein [Proteobacteria bacterium]|nr:4'-phosphopantetheinyl transferase superfamily protein [Pseudomonadota bacterium]
MDTPPAIPFPPLALGEICRLPQAIWLWVEPLGAGEGHTKTEGHTKAEGGAKAEGPSPVALSPQEAAQLEGLSHPRRRLEWKQSRLMAKQLLSKAVGGAPESFQLLSREEGPPLLLRGGQPVEGVGVSVSHTACYVGVACAPFAVGLDICNWGDEARIVGIGGRIFGEEERALGEACPRGFVALWALKEAALKLHGGGIFQPGLSSVHVSALWPPALSSPRAKAHLYALPEACVALVFEATSFCKRGRAAGQRWQGAFANSGEGS